MRALVDQAKAGIQDFWEQRRELVLLVGAADVDLPPVLKIVEGLETELAYAWSWIFAAPFAEPRAYADTIIADISARRDAVCATLAKEGKPVWPAPPSGMTDTTRDPTARLRTAVVYVRDLVPIVPCGVTVFGLLPTEIRQPQGYAALCEALVRHEMPYPWCARVRFMLRDDPGAPLFEALAATPRVRTLRTDFSPAALELALKREVADPSVPEERKMMSAIVAAGIDEAHGRPADALAHYRAALEYFGQRGDATTAALAAHGVASCELALGDTEAAERIWLAALEAGLAAQPPALPVILNVSLGLIMLVARQGRWFEVEAYAIIAQLIAKVLFMPSVQAEAEERRGIAQARQGKTAAAERSWRAAIATADGADDTPRSISSRTLLRNLLSRQEGRGDEARALAREIATLEQRSAHEHLEPVPA